MATTTFPDDVSVGGDLRVTGDITPKKAKSAVLELAELQAFTVPMGIWADHGDHHNMTPGTGISTGSGTVCAGHVSKHGSLIKTEIFIDMDGLESGDAGDIIGVAAAKNCYIGQLSADVNGTIVFGQVTCLETPAGGDPDIDFYGTVTEATGTQDTAITGLTGEAAFTANGDWAGAIATPIVFSALPGAGYMYMVDAGGTAVEYTAGQFLIEMWGTPATETLKYVPGTHGTNAPSLQTDNFAMNDTEVIYYSPRGEMPLPAEYVAGQSVKLRIHAGMLTTVADQSCTVDVEVYKSDEDSTSTGDLCTDAAVSDNMNSLVFADIDFTISPTTLSPGDILDVRLKVTADDDATPTVVKGCIGSVQLLCDVR